jgi:hypothetical protein
MNELTAGRGEYVTYREHITAKEEAQKRMAALELQLATMHAALMGVPDKLDKVADAVAALASKQASAPPQDSHTLLAIQRTLDVLSKQQPHSNVRDIIELMQSRGQSGGKTWALVGALAVVAVLLGWRAFTG